MTSRLVRGRPGQVSGRAASSLHAPLGPLNLSQYPPLFILSSGQPRNTHTPKLTGIPSSETNCLPFTVFGREAQGSGGEQRKKRGSAHPSLSICRAKSGPVLAAPRLLAEG